MTITLWWHARRHHVPKQLAPIFGKSLNKSDGLFNIAGLYLKSSLPWMDGPCLDRAGKDCFSLGAIWLSVGD